MKIFLLIIDSFPLVDKADGRIQLYRKGAIQRSMEPNRAGVFTTLDRNRLIKEKKKKICNITSIEINCAILIILK